MGKILIIKGADFSEVAVDVVTPSGGDVVITVKASPTAGGTVSGGGSYNEGDEVTLVATPKSGYAFSQWSDGVTTATRTITVGSSSKTYTAVFVERSSYALDDTADVQPAGGVSSGVECFAGRLVSSSEVGKSINAIRIQMAPNVKAVGAKYFITFASSSSSSSESTPVLKSFTITQDMIDNKLIIVELDSNITLQADTYYGIGSLLSENADLISPIGCTRAYTGEESLGRFNGITGVFQTVSDHHPLIDFGY